MCRRFSIEKADNIYSGDTPILTIFNWGIYDNEKNQIVAQCKTKKFANIKLTEFYIK